MRREHESVLAHRLHCAEERAIRAVPPSSTRALARWDPLVSHDALR